MKNTKKRIAAALLGLGMIFASGSAVSAQTVNFTFRFYSGNAVEGNHTATKADWEQRAYVTTTSVGGTGNFGFRVRTANGSMATEYRTWTAGEVNNKTLAYSILTGTPGNSYRLHGQADSSKLAASNGSGRWTP